MNGKTVGIIVLVIVVLLGGWWLMSGSSSTTNTTTTTVTEENNNTTPSTTGSTTTSPKPTGTTAAKTVITYTDNGFSPKNVTVPLGGTVTFVNQSSHGMWVASDVHPTHTDYDGTTKNAHCAAGYTGPIPFDECKPDGAGASYTFTFTKAGSITYHNHVFASDTGTITVTEAATSGSVNVKL